MKTDFANRGIEVAPNHCYFLLLLLLGKYLLVVKVDCKFPGTSCLIRNSD